ncbi:MAG: hypothetical protein ACLTYN_04710 [Dysosmobacter welbionis]
MKKMPLEVIENITRVEADNRERKASAEAKAKQIVADAQRDGLALLRQTRLPLRTGGGSCSVRRRQELRPEETRSGKKPRRRRSACAVRRRSGWTWLPISLSEGL